MPSFSPASTATTASSPTSLLGRLWASRWLVLVASFWIQACAGIGYAFGSFSPLIKSSLGYNQQRINILGNAKDIGDALGLISGSLCEILPVWSIFFIGALQNLIGYGWLWLIVTKQVASLPFWAICFLIFIGTNGECYFNTATLVTNVRNFPKSRGHIVGLLKGFTGLCSAVFTQIYVTFLSPDEAAYIFIIAVGPAMVACFVMFIVRPIKVKPGDSMRSEAIGFTFIYADCLVLAAYLMGVMILQDFVTLSFSVSLTFTLILFFLLLLPLATPIVSWLVRKNTLVATLDSRKQSRPPIPKPPVVEESKDLEVPLMPDDQLMVSDVVFTSNDLGQFSAGSRAGSFTGSVDFSELEDEKPTEIDLLPEPIKKQRLLEIRRRIVFAAADGAVRVKGKRRGPRRGEDFTLLQGLVKADFWLLFFALVCGCGTGLTVIDNMGQISESLGYDNSSIFVSMLSIWNFLGRLIGGSASEVIARSYGLPRSWALTVSQLLLAIGNFLFAMAWPGTLYIGPLLVGIGYGSHWGIVPPILSEIFGLKNFGMFYNFYILSSPIGSLFFSGFLAGYLYDLEAAKQNAGNLMVSSSSTCVGALCFRWTFLIMTGVCIFSIFLTTVVSVRTRGVYKMLYGRQQLLG